MGMKWMKLLSRLEYYKYPKYCGLQERRQLVCFLLTTFVELIYIPANLLGLNSYHNALFFDLYNWVHLCFVIGLQVAFWRNRISTSLAISIFFIAITFKLSCESLYELVAAESNQHVLGNLTVIIILPVVCLSVRLMRLSVIITIMLTVCLGACVALGPTGYMVSSMRIFFVGYMLIFFCLLYNTKAFGRGLRQPHVVDAQERKALQTLINLHEDEREQALSLMDQLSEDQKVKIRQNVQDYFREQEVDRLAYARLCPELTKSEIEICNLILQGKSLKEMCDMLIKSESNITSQRAHIRKKLGMNRKEELKSTLEFRIHEIRQAIKLEEKDRKK